jgi:hypothetical protein
VLNSLTKPECLVYQTGLSSFYSSNSAANFVKFQNRLFTPPPSSRRHQETFKKDTNPFRPKEEGEEVLGQEYSYLSVIGALMYLTNNTKPDIAFIVNYLATQTPASWSTSRASSSRSRTAGARHRFTLTVVRCTGTPPQDVDDGFLPR